MPVNSWVPSAFTPNKDGLNDYFKIAKTGIFIDFHLLIYNSWGNLIFESINPDFGWDGKFYGDAVESGVYKYNVTFTGKGFKINEQKIGKVTLIR